MSPTARWLVGSGAVGAIMMGGTILWLWPVLAMLGDPHRPHSYRVASESMAPTLAIGDVVCPRTPAAGDLGRGAVVALAMPDTVRMVRIVGTARDVVAMRAGHLSLNGSPVDLRDGGPGPVLADGVPSRLRVERLPGKRGAHRLLDAGPTSQDDVAPVRVPVGRLYVLGDDRDRAADSRFPPGESGVGLVPAARVLGIVDRLLWSGSFGERGRPIDGPERRPPSP